MNDSNLLDIYEDIKDDLKFLIKSDVRVKILISLGESPKDMEQLKKELKLRSSTILHGMYQLEKKHIITRESGNYSLTTSGEIYSSKLMDIVRSFHALNTCEDIFLKHDINCIPQELLKGVGCLNDSSIVNSITTDILRPHKFLMNCLHHACNIKIIASVLYTPNIQLIFSNLDESKIHLLLTREILDKILQELGHDYIANSLARGNLKIGIIGHDTKICFTMGDNFITLGLYFTNGEYDLNNLLFNGNKNAKDWGEKLFKYYQDSATDFNLEMS